MAAKVRKNITVRSEEYVSRYSSSNPITQVVEALAAELEGEGRATHLTVTTTPGRYSGHVKVVAKLSMVSG